MDRRTPACFWLWLAALAPAAGAQTPLFELGFSGPCGADVSGPAETLHRREFGCTLTTTGSEPGAPGAQGWTIAVASEGVRIASITTGGTVAALEPEGLRDELSFELSELTAGEGNEGAVSAVVLALVEDVTLPAEGTEVIARLDVEGLVPGDPSECLSAGLLYRDGLRGSGQPVSNRVTWQGTSVAPVLADCPFQLCPTVVCEEPVSLFFQDRLPPERPPQTARLFANRAEEILLSGPKRFYAAFASDLQGDRGIQGWSMSLGVEGQARAIAATTAGTVAALRPAGLRLSVSFELTELVPPELTGVEGLHAIVSAVVLGLIEAVDLESTGSATVLAIDVEPADGAGEGVLGEVRCQDGLRGSGQPVRNLVTVDGESQAYCCESVPIRKSAIAEVRFLRGDPNDDGRNNLADAVWIVNELFRGGPETRCQDAADVNDDGLIDLSDAVRVVTYGFQSGPPPAAPFPACGLDPTDDTGDGDPTNDLVCPPGSVDSCR